MTTGESNITDKAEHVRPGLVAHFASVIVSESMGLKLSDVMHPDRGPRAAAFARQISAYLVVVACGKTRGEAGDAFGRHNSTIAHGMTLIESLRDVEAFDKWLTRMELRLDAMLMASRMRLSKDSWSQTRAALIDALDDGDLDPLAVGSVVRLDAGGRNG